MIQAEEEHMRRARGVKGTVKRRCGWRTRCLEEPRLERGQAAPDVAGMPGSGLALLCGHVCEGGLGDGSAHLGGGTALPMSLVILDLQSSGPCGKGAHCSPGPSAAPFQPFPQHLCFLLLRRMTAHRSSGSLGSTEASSRPPNTVDSAIFDLRVPELYRQSATYHQIN